MVHQIEALHTQQLEFLRTNVAAVNGTKNGTKDEEKCEEILKQLKDYQEAEVRCQTSQTCWPSLKHFLPTYIAEYQALKAKHNC